MTPDPLHRATRRPRYGPFLASGAAAGVLATVVVLLTLGHGVDDQRRLAFYVGIMLAGLGALAGGGLAVWLERHDVGRPLD